MKIRRLFSLLLSVLLIASAASVCVIGTSAAETTTAEIGAVQGSYHNVSYLESEAQAYLATQADMSKTDLGATYTPEKTTWKVWAPTATRVQLKLYATGSDMESGAANIGKYEMTKDNATGTWSIALKDDYKNVYYTYLVTSSIGTIETFDIYAKAAGVNGDRSMVVDLDSTDPDGWDKDEHVFVDEQTAELIWEGHVADITSSDNSGVDANYQGKFLGFAEGGLTINGEDGAKSVGIDYLVEQGIKVVHIQCPFDFASGDETNPESYNWGYDPKNYNVPEGMYSTNPYDGNVRINEFKQLIQALHDRGISVVMGVVYNHTYGTEQSPFTYTVPGYYYRMSSASFYINVTACGNTMASDKAMFRSYMMQSLKYWVEEYHIDGFRFDLMASHDIETMNIIRNMFNQMYDGEGKKILMYGEPWTGTGGDPGLYKGNDAAIANMGKLSANIAGFNDTVRNAIKGVFSTGASIGGARAGVTGGTLGNFPNQSITYYDCHDGLTWWDTIATANGGDYDTTSAKATASLRTSYTYLLTAQGIPFTLAGTEFARSKYGNGNSYNRGDINAFDWERIETYATETAYAKGMSQIRRAFSPFSNGSSRVNPTFLTVSNTTNILAYHRTNTTAGEWTDAVVILNNGGSKGTVTLPAGTWTIVANGVKAGVESLGTASGTYEVEAYGSAVLVKGTTNAKAPEYEYVTVNHYIGDEIYKTSKVKYEVGTTWRANPDSYTTFDHNVTNVEYNAGTKDGNSVYGTVKKGENVVVNFYYEAFNTSGYITVKYVDESGKNILPDITYRILDGVEYNVPFKNVAGYELISEEYPTNYAGIFDAENPATIVFKFRPLASDGITVYYYNHNNWATVYMYAYTETIDEPLGAWNSKAQRMTKVTDPAELPEGEEVGLWYKKTIDSSTSQLDYDVTSCKVMFHNTMGSQEPLNGEAGYDAAGTIYIKNKILTFNTTVITSHIDAKTGEKLADDVVDVYNNSSSNDVYFTEKIASLGTAIVPVNASGNRVAGVTCVVYLYDTSGDVDKPTNPSNPEVGGILLGDADLDDKVNVKDATTIQKNVASLLILSADGKLAAEVDGDGKITVKDATAVQKWAADMNTGYAIGETIPGTGTQAPTQGGSDENSSLQDKFKELYNTASALLKDKAGYVVEITLKTTSDELKEKASKFGFDLSAEDTSKNEYQKYDALLTTVSYYVLQGGTDEELTKATADLQQGYDWFNYYVTELHKEPMTIDPSDPYAIDVSNGVYPRLEGYNTVVYSQANDSNWENVYYYCWSSSGGEQAAWPGRQMKFALVNDYGQKQYVAYVPVEYDNYIINNGNGGGSNQTIDLKITSSVGMYMQDTNGAEGKWTIGNWDPWA